MKRFFALFAASMLMCSLSAANPHVDRKEIKLKNGNTRISYDIHFYNGKLALLYTTKDGKTMVPKPKWGEQFFGLEFGRLPRTNGGWSIWNFFGCFQYKNGVHNLVAKFLPEQVTMNVINGAAVADLVYPSNDGAGKLKIRMIQYPSHQDWIFMRVTAENFSIWRMDFYAYPYQSDNPKDRERHLRMKEKDYNITAAGFKQKPVSPYIALYNKFLQDTAGYFLIFPHQKIKELFVPKAGASVTMRMMTEKNTQQYDFALGIAINKPAADTVNRFFTENADAIEKFMMQINWTPQLSTSEFDREIVEAVKMELDKKQLASLRKAYTAAIRNNDTAAAAKVLKNLQDLKLKKAKDGLQEFR